MVPEGRQEINRLHALQLQPPGDERRLVPALRPFGQIILSYFRRRGNQFLGGLLAWHLLLPDRDRSDVENRTLAQFPEFSWEDLKPGDESRLVPALRPPGQAVPPDFRRRGDQAQVHRKLRPLRR